MEIFRRPVVSSLKIEDVWFIFENTTMSQDFTTSFVYIAHGATLTVSAGFTLTCGEVVCDGTLIANGDVLATGATGDGTAVAFSMTKEAFRTMLSGGLASVPTVSTTKEAFRDVKNTTHLEVFP